MIWAQRTADLHTYSFFSEELVPSKTNAFDMENLYLTRYIIYYLYCYVANHTIPYRTISFREFKAWWSQFCRWNTDWWLNLFGVIKVYVCSCATGMLLLHGTALCVINVMTMPLPYTKLHITILIATEIEV